MKRINYLIMAVAAAIMTTSCTDEGPAAIRTASQVEITDITPVSAVAWIYNTNCHICIQIKKQQEEYFHDGNSSQTNNTFVEYGYPETSRINNYATNLNPGTTYDYKIVGTWRSSNGGAIDYELSSGSFTTPTIEEYYGKCTIVEQNYPTANSAELKFKLPDGISKVEYGDYYVYCSTSPDFTEDESIRCPVEFSGYNPSKFSCLITGLQSGTTYYVKISGVFLCSSYITSADPLIGTIDLSSTVHDYLLETEPSSFSTPGEGETSPACTITADYIIDTSTKINIRLTDLWEFYDSYNAPNSCSIIYSTDPQLKHYEVAKDVSWNNNGCTCTFHNNLLPETCYYVALKGDFRYVKYDSYGTEMMDAVLPAGSFTTGHANQYTLINGHKAVDLGLSVKWASCNIGAASPDESGEYFEGPTIPYIDGEQDIAGTEYDIATKQWGAGWAMPTQDQWKELFENCKLDYFGTGEDEYCLAVGSNGNYIYIPKTGWYSYSNDSLKLKRYTYWTSILDRGAPTALYDIVYFHPLNHRDRLQIRAVAK